jgi:hypothetical protein
MSACAHRTLMLTPPLALVSINIMSCSFALASASSMDTWLHTLEPPHTSKRILTERLDCCVAIAHTCNTAFHAVLTESDGLRSPPVLMNATSPRPGTHRFSAKSVLLPTSTMTTSSPLSVRTSSIHFGVLRKDCRSAPTAPQQQHLWCPQRHEEASNDEKLTCDVIHYYCNR